jgi:hypothetical protein
VGKKFVAKTLLYPPGSSEEAASPDIAKNTDQNSDSDDVKRIYQQRWSINLIAGKIVYGPLNNTRDE